MSIPSNVTIQIKIDSFDNAYNYAAQAEAITHLLMSDGENASGFNSNHKIISNSIWALSDLLHKLQKELKEGRTA